jgi:transcriptional regulator with XRE-family HTH domain
MYTSEEFNKKLGAALKAERIRARMSTRQVGDIMNVANATIVFWETGRNTVSAAALAKLCEVYGITLTDFTAKYFDE